MRPSGRGSHQLRKVKIHKNYNKHAEGSCLVEFGDTHVICTVSVEDKMPAWLRDSGRGWVTAEYGMLPRATNTRTRREASSKGQGGRTHEIQRLIGRSLRAVTNLKQLGELQLRVDCDVIQADGGTRTASITGGYVALSLACKNLLDRGLLSEMPLTEYLAAVSCGIHNNSAVLDLEYVEDSEAHADTNFVLTENFNIVEIQATAEEAPFSQEFFDQMFLLAKRGISELVNIQKAVLET